MRSRRCSRRRRVETGPHPAENLPATQLAALSVENFTGRLPVIRMTPIVTSAVLLIAFHSVGRADEKFGKVGVYLERTVEDQDSEVRFEVTGGDVGLATLRVVAPDGRTVIDFKAPDSKLGM